MYFQQRTLESDLGILSKKNLKFDEHINNNDNKVNRIIGLIKRKFTYMDKKEVFQKTKGRQKVDVVRTTSLTPLTKLSGSARELYKILTFYSNLINVFNNN